MILEKVFKRKWKESLRKLFVKGINSILGGYCDGLQVFVKWEIRLLTLYYCIIQEF